MYVIKGDTIKISVRNLVEFICRSGDITTGTGGVMDAKLMQEGSKIHRRLQKQGGTSYHGEVPLSVVIDESTYSIKIEGRADGIICDLDEDEEGNSVPVSDVTIDEIKTVMASVKDMEEPAQVHKAQAMCYAYIYASQKQLEEISVRMTYVSLENEEIKTFTTMYLYDEIKLWFDELINKFKIWCDYVFENREKRNASVMNISFPFQYRAGQRNLIANVYRNIEQKRNLYIQAPTGVGKTISTIYPAVQACGRGMADKIFYLTSKTITRTVAEDTFAILRNIGLWFSTITLTAKDKVCHMEKRDCNPQSCPYAKGHYDRINDAVYNMITNETTITRDIILAYSERHNVCPFEMSLDASYWCDGIICDYNYVFDPDVALKRYFGEGNTGEYIFLIDESHNLVDRAREMYSSVLKKEDFLSVKKLVQDQDKKLYNALEKCNSYLLKEKRLCNGYRVIEDQGQFPLILQRCYSVMQTFFERNRGKNVDEKILDFFFEVRHFLNMYDCVDEKYVVYTEIDDNQDFLYHLYCVDPSGNISQRLLSSRSAVFFSATLLPVNYYKEMLSGEVEDDAVYALSSFPMDNKRIIVSRDVTSRYTRRNKNEYLKICNYIGKTVQIKAGNYIVFFPSYSFMNAVYSEFSWMYPQIEVRRQSPSMSETDREEFLDAFTDEKTKFSSVGFCVSGGIFSEGIDLKEDRLIGALIVGTGLPMVCRERNILKDYFDENGKDGYRYAYTYPGMNKVLQASGRVIRTENDRGIIMLLDDRFLNAEYRALYPREWDKICTADENTFVDIIEDFWVQ